MSDMNFISSVQLSKDFCIPHKKLKELIRKHKVSCMGMGVQHIAGEGKQRGARRFGHKPSDRVEQVETVRCR